MREMAGLKITSLSTEKFSRSPILRIGSPAAVWHVCFLAAEPQFQQRKGVSRMSITSHAFGRVTLTGRDADKFARQVKHGKPKAAAVDSVKRGVELSRSFQENGTVRFTVRTAVPR
jgi:hypothetical protein